MSATVGRSARTTRVAWAGAVHVATPSGPAPQPTAAHGSMPLPVTPPGDGNDGAQCSSGDGDAAAQPSHVRLADGRIVGERDVVWLPPFDVGTVIALGLNYADHVRELAKELTVTAKDEPLVFFKGPGTLLGHRGCTRRPRDVTFMHYECELAVVIGRPARRVRAADAMAHVAGYTVCNDYAFRDYLENWYRPNLRVKNRDGATVLGPWFVPAAEVPDPGSLVLHTSVNGVERQRGSTRDFVHTIGELIEYLSAFMTLNPGDVLLTGTPEGVVDVLPGDEVVTSIDGIGRLVNTVVGDDAFGL